ncbi:GlsB/YeaQ/YmgE family stress response membrane protein [Ruminococcus sp. HUN007]|uniref:GlsB/YeaQ/YmgE family stress response membrane protein n=1 Tax=Ruminococcus sp. HUN007 TaxID=1514668 RepID=UPI0005D2444A|nr:GlsB/YeaQ/YmgE family stress response membrane protein [Ruminococcus sp. HUN007]
MITLIVSVIVGAIIGSIAGKLMDNKRMGFWKNAFFGILGSAVGGYAGEFLHTGGLLINFVLSVAGACLVIFIARKITGRN